ncbi:unnamed protein product [Pieris macdunnoughi]|uniref:Uncharacterized protein n=1 Tax=Pieris macdunnoughi TaxID=345717 RepID=A0A821SCV4_9NEOP|nr:unnamed protein product [Pieris macdunnoughi]
MSRRSAYGARLDYSPPPPTNCAKFLYYSWRLCSVVFSHFVMISLVVAYCILGAVTFERLESQHEREVKKNISQIRANTTYSIWQMTNRVSYLSQSNWTSDVLDMLKEFENAILLEMKVRGWDGSESPDRLQWTFTGALFYSIVVITTIALKQRLLGFYWMLKVSLSPNNYKLDKEVCSKSAPIISNF